jgi:hypothetical protein
MKRLLAVAILAFGLSSTTACSPHLFRHAVAAAVVTAAIVGTVHVLRHHDSHYHHRHCGHSRRYHDGQWVYYYEDRWEYYDEDEGRWYYYRD